jgi:hypothetical protein
MMCTSNSSSRVGVVWCGGLGCSSLTDIKTNEVVDDNGAAESEASRAEIRWCFVDVLKIRRHEMKQTSFFIPLFMNCGIMRLHAGTSYEESGAVAFS